MREAVDTFELISSSYIKSRVFDLVDRNFTNDILTGAFTAQWGGSSAYGLNLPLPLLKAEGSAYELQGGFKFDEDIPIIGGTEPDATGRVGGGKAYTGIDEGSLGLSAKAALAEGDVSQVLNILFTDTDVRFTLGGSAGSIGGEAKIGRETMIDLRALFGLKFGNF